MPSFLEIDDVVATPEVGDTPARRARVRIDRRPGPTSAPTLILLGGMTQTVHAWGAHLRPLSETREVIAYEARGQGATELDLADCTISRHVADFEALLAALGCSLPVDLCGFSFGGRVATAIAARRPDLVGRLVLTGVAMDRGIIGRLIVDGWYASLRTGDLEALARITLPDILGAPYLDKHADLVESMVRAAVQRNRFDGIVALFESCLRLAPDSPWHIGNLAHEVRHPALVLGGALDRLAPPREVRALADLLKASHQTFADVGHTVPIESPAAWREAVLAFLR